MLRGNQVRLRTGGGRSSDQTRIVDTYHRRRERGEPFLSTAAEARAIVSELAEYSPDRPPPGFSTVRRHLSALRAMRS
jgi:hypothetical protein